MRLRGHSPTRPTPGPRAGARAGSATAFTLVELLVTLGIIAVLMGILLPTLGKMKEKAAAAKCASNLRQLAAGWQMYADANQRVSAPGRLPKYAGEVSIFGMGDDSQYRPRWYE